MTKRWSDSSAGGLKLVADETWKCEPIDPYVRLALALIVAEDSPDRVLRIRGCHQKGRRSNHLPVLAKLKPDEPLPDGLLVPPAYRQLGVLNVAGEIDLGDISDHDAVFQRVADVHRCVARLKLALPKQSQLHEALRDTNATPDLTQDPPLGYTGLDGTGAIIGIIDDGCAFAHRHFLRPGNGASSTNLRSRILYLWDQSSATKDTSKGWSQPEEFGYGDELTGTDIDRVLHRHMQGDTILEQDVYADAGYEIGDVDSHGTHVMDIAAGNGSSLAGSGRGVAPNAELIFVQLPKNAIGSPSDAVLSKHILDGVAYVFLRARRLAAERGSSAVPAVVNISYGGYGGPHDGTSLLECGLDELLEETDRAVVVAAGNGFIADCHANRTLKPGVRTALRWIVGPDDPTLNLLEIWYPRSAMLDISLKAPSEAEPFPGAGLGDAAKIQTRRDEKIVGWIFHRDSDSGNSDHHVLIALRPTSEDEASKKEDSKVAPAPFGTWEIHLTNVGPTDAEFHAWIERDDAGVRGGARRRQSRFFARDASPTHTLSSMATGKRALSIGGYNAWAQEIARYSACGPTRDGRLKPEVCAPAEEEAAEMGILCAASLSGQPFRMNGTSAAAPFIAGLIARMFQAAKGSPLSADQIRERIVRGVSTSRLGPNLRQQANPATAAPPGTLELRVGAGKIDIGRTET